MFGSNHSKLKRFQRRITTGLRIKDVRAVIFKPEVDFKDPDWKMHFQEDFDRRFNLPHLRDILDVQPRPTTFSLKSR